MLKNVTLNNFRKHEDITVEFVDGLNIIKAGNEEGKTTLMEGVGYNWFGSGALRQPIKGVVTRGMKVGKLFTQTTLHFKGVDYRVTRSNKGAEVWKDSDTEPAVTGQKEVTAYMENLFGIPSGKASSLIISEQGDIRGVLSKGAADTSKFIENLANFSEIDELVNTVATKISTGSNQIETDNLELAEKAVEELEPVTAPDESALQDERSVLTNEISGLSTETQKLNKAIAEADAVVSSNKANKELKAKFENQIASAKKSIDDLGEVPEELTASVDEVELSKMRERSSVISGDLLKAGADLHAYSLFKKLPSCEAVWDEPFASFEKEIKSAQKEHVTLQKIKEGISDEILLKNASFISGDTCQTCGNQPDVAKVESHNETVTQDLGVLQTQFDDATANLKTAREYLVVLEGILSTGLANDEFAKSFPNNISMGGDTQFPREISFIGYSEEPTELNGELDRLTSEIAKMDTLIQEIKDQKEKVDNYTLKSAEHKANLSAAKTSLSEIPEDKPEVDVAKEQQALVEVSDRDQAVRLVLSELEKNFTKEQAKFEAYGKTLARLNADTINAKNALEEKNLANLLMKDIRTARGRVTNKIWGTVLTVVSNYFSKMRGEVSQVTKGEKDFLVNGESIKGLSGSTLDILGLAFRIAQSELFLTGVPLLILDEVTSACDDNRSSTMIGLLGSATDKQTVLITHDDISEDVADNLIELGA